MDEGIRVVPERGIDKALMAFLCRSLSQAFHCPCILDEPMWHPVTAYHASRAQYSAEAILRRLVPESDEHVLGVVDVDIFVPPYRYVLGLAHSDRRRALISLARLREPRLGEPFRQDQVGEQTLCARMVDEAIHQLADTYQVDPDDYVGCVSRLKDLLLDDARYSHVSRASKHG